VNALHGQFVRLTKAQKLWTDGKKANSEKKRQDIFKMQNVFQSKTQFEIVHFRLDFKVIFRLNMWHFQDVLSFWNLL
jgi:hypothetical protein